MRSTVRIVVPSSRYEPIKRGHMKALVLLLRTVIASAGVALPLMVVSTSSPTAGAASIGCTPAQQVVARKYAGPDKSVTVMMETESCLANTINVRANGRNEATSGKSDWAIALKYSQWSCHDDAEETLGVVHPQIPRGGNQATPWAFAELRYGWFWAEVSTTYPDGRHYRGETSCWRS